MAAAGYALLAASLTGQALRGQSLIHPDVLTLAIWAGIAVATAAGAALVLAGNRRPPARVRLSVAVADGAVRWEVADDGGGTPPADPPPGGGNGITGMRERAEVLGGRLEAGPAGGGWRVATTLPAAGVSVHEPGLSAP